MRTILVALLTIVAAFVASGCGPDCSTGAYPGSVWVEDDTVFNFVTAQIKEPIGSVHDRNLFRGCSEISGILFLARPNAFEVFDDLEVVTELRTIQRGETERELWTLPDDAFPSLTEVRGLFRNGGARIEGLNAVESIGSGLGICAISGLNNLRVAGELRIGAGRSEDSRCDQSGLVSLEEILGDLTVTGFEEFETGNVEPEDLPLIDWPAYQLPGRVREIGGSLVIGMDGSFEATDLVTVGHDVRIDNTITGGQPADIILPRLDSVGWGFWFLGRFLREVRVPAGLEPNHLFVTQLTNIDNVVVVNKFGNVNAIVVASNNFVGDEQISSFVERAVDSADEVLTCGNRDDELDCAELDISFVFQEQP